MINPGTNVDECFINVADIIVTFESNLGEYNKYKVSPWNANYPPSKFCHMVYGVTKSNLQSTYKKTQSNRAGYVFISDGGHNRNPSYLTDEINLIK